MNGIQGFANLPFGVLLLLIVASCTSPKSVTNTGKVTPYKQFSAGADYNVNIPTHFISSVIGNVSGIVNPLVNQDSILWDEQLLGLNETAIAYSLDPLGSGYNFYARYGLLPRTDIGYKYYSGTHVFDARFQFLGSNGSILKPGSERVNASVGVQYSHKDYSLPSWEVLDVVQDILGMYFTRNDLLIPILLSYSFGEEEKIGAVTVGVVYGMSFLKYGFEPGFLYQQADSLLVDPVLIEAVHEKNKYHSWGLITNLKLGYKYAYLMPSMAIYYQNYGEYKLLNGDRVSFKGFSFLPSIGLQINISEIANGIAAAGK